MQINVVDETRPPVQTRDRNESQRLNPATVLSGGAPLQFRGLHWIHASTVFPTKPAALVKAVGPVFRFQRLKFNEDLDDNVANERWSFLGLATLIEGGTALLALGLAWLLGISLWHQFDLNGRSLMLGVLGTVPMLGVFWVTYSAPVGPFGTIKRFLLEALGPPLSQCRWYDLLWIAALAGCCEELLFRGVFQSWVGQSNWWLGLVISNLLFGLAHAVTPTYALVAALLGTFLGVLYSVDGNGNLVAPILCHSLYDLVAFVIVQQSVLARRPVPQTVEVDAVEGRGIDNGADTIQ
jgi:uncharacterized protein